MHGPSLLLTAPRQLEWVSEDLPPFDYQTTAPNLITTFEKLASGTIMPIKVLVKYNAEITKTLRNGQ